MADLNYTVSVDSRGAQQSLQNLQNQVNKLDTAMSGLKSAIAGLALGAAIRNAILYADSIQDISDATGIAIEKIAGFTRAVELNGGNAEQAQAAMLRLSQSIGEAAAGSQSAQDAFGKVGITLSDLARLSEEQLFDKVIQGLAGIEDISTRAKLQNELLGKSLRGVSLQKVAEGLGAATDASRQYADSIRKAAELQNKLDTAFGTFRSSLLRAIEPLADFINNLDQRKIDRFIEALVGIGSAIGVIYGLRTAFLALVSVIGVVGSIVANVNPLIRGLVALASLLAGAGRIVYENWSWFREYFNGAIQEMRELLGLSEKVANAGAGRGGSDAITKQLQQRGEELRKQSEEERNIAERRKVEASEQAKRLEQQRQEIRRIAAAFENTLNTRAAQLTLETDLIGKSQQQKDLQTALAELAQKTTDEVNKLREAQANLNEEQRKGGLVEEYNRQIAAVQELGKSEQIRLATLVKGLNEARNAEEFRTYQLKQQQDLEDQLLNIERQLSDITLPAIEKGYRDIERAAYDSATAAIRAEEARRGEPLNAEEVRRYYETAASGARKVADAQKRLTDANRSFATGWKRAFNEYVDAATNAADRAGRLFSKFTQGIEDALVDFAKTGKLNWRSFVADMAEELLRSQIRETIASIGTSFGLGDLFGKGGSQSTRGQSATNPLYVMDVSSGGGVMGSFGGNGAADPLGDFINKMGIGGVRNNPTISGGGIGGGSSGGGFLDTILGAGKSVLGGIGSVLGDIGSTVGDWFGGFFANGGTLPAGKVGIVGERGPEMISGPATITPMGGQSVVYNINAVDAASFKALVAADPGFIHSVAELGRGRMPGARR